MLGGRAREHESLGAGRGVFLLVHDDRMDDVGRDGDVTDPYIALRCLRDNPGRLGPHDPATYVDDGVPDVHVLASEFSQFAEAQGGPIASDETNTEQGDLPPALTA